MSEKPSPTPIDAPARTPSQTVIVPVDGTDRSRRALVAAAIEFDDAELVVLYVLEPYVATSVTDPAVWDDEFASRREREANRVLEEYRDLAAARGTDVRTELARGPPTRAIVDASEKFGADRIVVSRAGKIGLLRRLAIVLLGTVSKRAPAPVTVATIDYPAESP